MAWFCFGCSGTDELGLDVGEDGGFRSDSGRAPDGGGPDDVIRPQTCFAFTPDHYFHSITLGRTALLRVSLSNRCEGDRSILSAFIDDGEGDTPFTVDPAPYPIALEPGARTKITTRFRPLHGRLYEASLVIQTDDPIQAEIRIRLHGDGRGGTLRPLPRRVHFRPTPIGCASSTRTVSLVNEGPGPMFVTSIELEGASFEISESPVLPIEVEAEAMLSVALRFRPSAVGEHEGALELKYNGRSSPTIVPVSGTGLASASYTDTFLRAASPKVDVLVVVGDDPTHEKAELIIELTEAMQSAGVDYQLAIVPAGRRDAALGQIRGCPMFPDFLSPDIAPADLRESLVRCMVSVSAPDWTEAGVGAVQKAVDRAWFGPEDPDLNPNRVWLRDGARLSVLLLGDRDRWFVPMPAVMAFLAQIEAPRLWRISGLARATDGLCAVPDPRYLPLIEVSDGVADNPCNPDWPVFTSALRDVLTQPDDALRLTAAAEPGSLEVRKDGALVASSSTTFVFDAAMNQLDLAPSQATESWEVRYDVECR